MPEPLVHKPLENTQGRTLTLLPFFQSSDMQPIPLKERLRLRALLTEVLTHRGWKVVDSAFKETDWRAKFNQIKETEGFFDPKTGSFRQDRFDAFQAKVLQQVMADDQATLALWPKILVVEATVKSDHARWYGVEERSSEFWDQLLSDTTVISGTLPASILRLQLYDQKGLLVFDHAGGIELLKTFNKFNWRFTTSIDEKPQQFKNPKRLDRALEISVMPLFSNNPEQLKKIIQEQAAMPLKKSER